MGFGSVSGPTANTRRYRYSRDKGREELSSEGQKAGRLGPATHEQSSDPTVCGSSVDLL